jgi:hypothetical protein
MAAIFLVVTGVGVWDRWDHVGVHELSECVDENDADTARDVYGF